jgi:hypothetical protein
MMKRSTSSDVAKVQRCLLCRGVVERQCEGRFVTTSCLECCAVLRVEFDPPDDPTLRARIERLDDVDDSGRPEVVEAYRTSPLDAEDCADAPSPSS